MKYEDILFDLDGTITESAEGIVNSVMYALKKRGYEVGERSELYKFVGPPLAEMFGKYCGTDLADGKKSVEVYREYYAEKGIFECSIYEGVAGLLADLKKAGRRVFLATSKPEIYAKKILEHFDVARFFDGIHGCELDGRRAEKADVIAVVKQEHDIKNAVMVGDRCYDVEGAKIHGLPCIGVLYGYGSREELTDAVAVAEDVAELRDMLM